jgi:hypothetical protein
MFGLGYFSRHSRLCHGKPLQSQVTWAANLCLETWTTECLVQAIIPFVLLGLDDYLLANSYEWTNVHSGNDSSQTYLVLGVPFYRSNDGEEYREYTWQAIRCWDIVTNVQVWWANIVHRDKVDVQSAMIGTTLTLMPIVMSPNASKCLLVVHYWYCCTNSAWHLYSASDMAGSHVGPSEDTKTMHYVTMSDTLSL